MFQEKKQTIIYSDKYNDYSIENNKMYAGNFEKRWKVNEARSHKNGPRHAISFIRHNPEYEESKKSGKPQPAWKSGKIYNGDWNHDKRQGFGTQTWPNGNKYEGDWYQNKRHGKGTFWVKEGARLRKQYTGDWLDNLRDGVGIFYYKSGHKYEGEWRQNTRHGRGKMVYATGDVYEGDWVEDKRSGLGVLTMANGDRYEGHWLNDKKEGPGRYFYRVTCKMYEGEWVDDTAKCGVYQDIPASSFADEESQREFLAQNASSAFQLQRLGLVNTDEVLTEAVANVRRKRAAERGAKAIEVAGGVFNQEELSQLQEAFGVVDQQRTGRIPSSGLKIVLESLGMEPMDEDIAALMMELGTNMEGNVSFAEFTGVLARLKI